MLSTARLLNDCKRLLLEAITQLVFPGIPRDHKWQGALFGVLPVRKLTCSYSQAGINGLAVCTFKLIQLFLQDVAGGVAKLPERHSHRMIGAAKVHPSHFHIVAASVVKEQDEIRSQINTLRNHPDVKELAMHKAAIAAQKRMSRFVEQTPSGCLICRELLLQDTNQPTVHRLPTAVCRRDSTTSMLPPQLFDVWPRILQHLLQRTAHLRRLLERVERIFTREACVKTVWVAIWNPGGPSPRWAAMVAAGLRDREELQLLLEMMFSDVYGSRCCPDSGWYQAFADAAAIKGWQLPVIRTWGDFDSEVVHDLQTAGFQSELLRQPRHNPTINLDNVWVPNPDGHIEPRRI